jgi:DnaJ-class molecular chaperone
VRFEFGNESGFGDDPGGGFGSIFERLFRAGPEAAPQTRPQTQRGHDIEHDVRVSLAEAFAGTTRRVQVQSIEDGEPIGKQLEVTIPAGVESGSKVRLRGKGAPGIGGGPPGDVVLIVEVAIDPLFERKGNSLRTDIPLPLTVAMLGGEAEVGTLDGSVLLNIPPGTQNGRVFRLGGKGMPLLNASEDQRGDLFARVRVVLPEGLSDEERELVRRLHELRHGNDRDAGSASHDAPPVDPPVDETSDEASGDQRNDSPTAKGGDA